MVKGGMHGGGGMCGDGGMHGKGGHAWQGGMCGRGACMAEGRHAWQGGMQAGEMATEAGGMHPTGIFLSFALSLHLQGSETMMIHAKCFHSCSRLLGMAQIVYQ